MKQKNGIKNENNKKLKLARIKKRSIRTSLDFYNDEKANTTKKAAD